MKKILISVDHKWRDLPSSVFLKLKLESKGYEVHLCRDALIPFYEEGIRPDAVIFVHLYSKERQQYAKELKKRNIKVYLLPTEGIPTLKSYRKFASGFFNDLSGVEEQFCWNNHMRKLVEKNNTLKKATTIGVPRFDFYDKRLKDILLSKKDFCSKYNLQKEYPIITLATNFTQAQFFKKNKDFFDRDSKKLGYKKIFDSKSKGSEDILEIDFNSRNITMAFFELIVKKFKKCNFILKTHPSEDFIFYKDFFEKKLTRYQNRIALVNQEYIWDILNVTDIELSRSCTTAVESWLLNLPTIELRLNKEEWYISEEFSSGSYKLNSESEYIETINQILNGLEIDPSLIRKRSKFFEEWCYKTDGNSTQRLADKIDVSLKNSSKKMKKRINYKRLFIYFALKYSRNLIHDLRVYNLGYIFKLKYDKLGRMDKYINQSDVRYWESRLRRYS